jgi:hypothetical protein
MWDRLAGTLKHGTSPPERERRVFRFYGLGSGSSNNLNNDSFDSWHETSGGTATYSYSIQGGCRSLVTGPSRSQLALGDLEEFDELAL